MTYLQILRGLLRRRGPVTAYRVDAVIARAPVGKENTALFLTYDVVRCELADLGGRIYLAARGRVWGRGANRAEAARAADYYAHTTGGFVTLWMAPEVQDEAAAMQVLRELQRYHMLDRTAQKQYEIMRILEALGGTQEVPWGCWTVSNRL